MYSVYYSILFRPTIFHPENLRNEIEPNKQIHYAHETCVTYTRARSRVCGCVCRCIVYDAYVVYECYIILCLYVYTREHSCNKRWKKKMSFTLLGAAIILKYFDRLRDLYSIYGHTYLYFTRYYYCYYYYFGPRLARFHSYIVSMLYLLCCINIYIAHRLDVTYNE